MIQYNELHAGNWAFFENEKVIIQSIHSMNERTVIRFKKLTPFQTLEELDTTIEKIGFIRLNKNIMTLLDFDISFIDEQKKTTYYHHKIDRETNKSFFVTEFEGFFIIYSYRFKSKFVRISNVHELQNLFYMIKNSCH